MAISDFLFVCLNDPFSCQWFSCLSYLECPLDRKRLGTLVGHCEIWLNDRLRKPAAATAGCRHQMASSKGTRFPEVVLLS